MTLSSLQDWQRADFFLEGGDGYMSIKKIAEKAGVSPATVSRVLNNRGYISDKTREKVYRVMKELNYQLISMNH